MGFLDRLFGTPEPERPRTSAPTRPRLTDDELAVERYRYLLRTAPPESIEQVHSEAFARLTPEQRALVYRALVDQAPAGERIVSDEPAALARAATRQELRSPGSVERAFANADAAGARGGSAGPSLGGMFGSSLLGSIAGVVVGSAIAQAFLPDPASSDAAAGDAGAGDTDASGEGAAGGADAVDASAAPDAYGYDDSDHRWGDGGNPDDGFFGGGGDGSGFGGGFDGGGFDGGGFDI